MTRLARPQMRGFIRLDELELIMSACCCSRGPLAFLAVVALSGLVAIGIAAASDDAPKAPPAPGGPAAPSTPARPAAPTDRAPAASVGDPYPLATCPVAGEKLDGKAVIHVHEGREFRFCCDRCVEKFKADPAKFIAEVDKKIIADQKALYPLKTCVVMGKEELTDGESEDMVYNNRLVRFCCKKCVKRFTADPAKFWAELDAAVIAAQKPTYKLDTCPVSGDKLGSHGEPVDLVMANRLVRLCCKECVKEVKKDPAAVMAAASGR